MNDMSNSSKQQPKGGAVSSSMTKSFKKKSMTMVSSSTKVKSVVEFGFSNPSIENNNMFPDNTITTTKYNIITFVPKSLLLQFRRAANIYFLIVTILTCMKFSPKQPGSMIGTFAFVLMATMVKDAIEDYNRYKHDKAANDRPAFKFSKKNKWKKVKCSSLRPGDFIKVVKEEELSADTLILKTSNENGYSYIDTKNLDGETNLKEKCAIEEFRRIQENELLTILGTVECDKPNENLMVWEGVINYKGATIYASLKNLILKGSVLKNTDDIIGLVVYSGKNTKIIQNSKRPKVKVSKILKTMNKLLYSLFIFVVLMCAILAIFSVNLVEKKLKNYNYLYPNWQKTSDNKPVAVMYFLSFLTFLVAYAQIIPISLYVALEIVKIMQGLLIVYDAEMYDLELNKSSNCRATDLIEELGQIQFIFSDKTGTLTQNNMILKKVYVDGLIYGDAGEDDEKAKFTINGDNRIYNKLLNNETVNDLFNPSKLETNKIEDFFYLLTLCHSVFPEKTDRGIVYQGSSPDDIAMVKGAQQLGFEFSSKDFNDIYIFNHIYKTSKTFELLAEIPFDSDKKCMSVIIQEKNTDKIILFSKGADSAMLKKIEMAQDEFEQVNDICNKFSQEGLRILVMGRKYLDPDTFYEWKEKYNDSRKKGKNLSKLYSEMECDLEFIGVTAIEDKLQEGVPETIKVLLDCNIRMWVLTGDKHDTALEIAKSCNLINESMNIIDLIETEVELIDEKLNKLVEVLNIDIEAFKEHINLDEITAQFKEVSSKDLAIIVDGATLEMILADEDFSRKLFYISLYAKSVLCCRVSPKQKARVVSLAKKYGKWVTLAIGDGANDVPMLMEAHIGVGIHGKEGTQAVRSADFAIGKFRFLQKLLLVYGRTGYVKISKFICYYFYKNIIVVFTEVCYIFFVGFSGQIFFADYLSTMYNAFFTSWPCLFTFSLEKDHDLALSKSFPILYKAGQKNKYFNLRVFWKYIVDAIIHASLAFFIPTLGLMNIENRKGELLGHWLVSTVSFTLIIHSVTIKLLLISDYWNWVNICSSIFSIIFYYLCLFTLCSESISKSFQNELIGVSYEVFTNLKILIVIFIGPILCVAPDIIIKQFYYNFYPWPNDYLRKHILCPEIQKIVNNNSFGLFARGIRRSFSVNPHHSSHMIINGTMGFKNNEFTDNPISFLNDPNKFQDMNNLNVAETRDKHGSTRTIKNLKRKGSLNNKNFSRSKSFKEDNIQSKSNKILEKIYI